MTTLTDGEREELFSRPRELNVARDAEVLEGVVEQIVATREADLREQIAVEIEALTVTKHQSPDEFDRGWDGAVSIARGGAS